MKSFSIAFIGSALLAASFAGCSSSDDKAAKPAAAPEKAPEAPKPLTVERSAEIVVTATVQAVNQATREVTLKDSSGHTISFIAGDQVKRLNEVKAGDEVTAKYRVSIIGELRPPTAEEAQNPIMAVAVSGRATKDEAPAAGTAQAVRVVTTVQAVDQGNMTVTLRGPMGDTSVVRARSLENLKKLHVGDTIVITYTEAMAISVEKAAPKK